MMSTSKQHRQDIDGLRAIAILPVVLFHLSFRYTPGGFIGVDVFFVISGYLITLHILSELSAGKFSIVRFYERRIRRIFPAACAMLLVSSLVAYKLLLPSELVDFAKTLISAVGSVSNIYLWATTNYFDVADKPLLHTWSLAVEEQFYIFLPPLLIMFFAYRRRLLKPGILALAAASFVLSAITVRSSQSATFYLLPQRAWELLMGSILAMGVVPKLKSQFLSEALAFLGLISILALVFVFPHSWAFPGPTALFPCMGAALIIFAGETHRTIVGRMLSTRLLVGIGLISYSVYLWHLPLIIFQSYSTRFTFGSGLRHFLPFLSGAQAITVERDGILLALSFLLGWASWYFVEQPTRFGRLRVGRRKLFIGSAIAAAALATFGLSMLLTKGFPHRFSPEVIRISSYDEKTTHYRDGSCFVGKASDYKPAECLHESKTQPNWLLFGDSHAAHLAYGLSKAFPSINLMQWTMHGCKPLLTLRYGEDPACAKDVGDFYRSYLPAHHPTGIILAANWQEYDLPRLGHALETLRAMHQNVVLIGPVMHYDAPLRRLLAQQVESGDVHLAAEHRVQSYDTLDATMGRLAATEWHVPYFSYDKAFCREGLCREWASPDVPLQFDQSHLLGGGSILVGEAIEEQNLIPAHTGIDATDNGAGTATKHPELR